MVIIEKIKLINFKRFQELTLEFNKESNTIIGDNESGKSTVLLAIDLVLSGSKNKIDNIGLESLFNKDCILRFLESNKHYKKLPELFAELYINGQDSEELNGRNNSDHKECDGLRLKIYPDDNFSYEIIDILKNDDANFPFEFYKCDFSTFQGKSYSGYKRFINHILIDNSKIGNEYAMKEYINNMYNNYIEGAEIFEHQNKYRNMKNSFNDTSLKELNQRTNNYYFGVKNDSKSNMLTDLTIFENDVAIENKGKGKQCFIKTEFAISKSKRKIDIVLMEEPENHLSYSKMQLLINQISKVKDRQLFITTHNSLISSRLDLKKAILLSSTSEKSMNLENLDNDTAKYFMKAPDHKILEFVLSKKVILVEGDAEYILMSKIFEAITHEKESENEVTIISVDGISFKRYLDIAKILSIKTAVIRDNDKDYTKNCIDNYKEYINDIIQVFADNDVKRYTFEISIYLDNKEICDKLFSSERIKLSAHDYMLKNKTEAAFALLENSDVLIVPDYIKKAIEWINE
jgi:predicted ATP-dependent endonuclease of OLD family